MRRVPRSRTEAFLTKEKSRRLSVSEFLEVSEPFASFCYVLMGTVGLTGTNVPHGRFGELSALAPSLGAKSVKPSSARQAIKGKGDWTDRSWFPQGFLAS